MKSGYFAASLLFFGLHAFAGEPNPCRLAVVEAKQFEQAANRDAQATLLNKVSFAQLICYQGAMMKRNESVKTLIQSGSTACKSKSEEWTAKVESSLCELRILEPVADLLQD